MSKQVVSDILKQEKTWLIIQTGTPSAKQMRNRKPAFIEVNDAMKLWVDQIIEQKRQTNIDEFFTFES